MKKATAVLFFLFLFTFIHRIHAQGIWHNLGGGIYGRQKVLAICPDTINNILYVGGTFDSVASVKQLALAKWNGIAWDSTVTFIDPSSVVSALIMFKGKLYVGFESGLVGVYDSSKFTYINGFNAAARCFCIYNNSLYAGGDFYGNVSCIARLAGKNWVAVDKGMRWEDCCASVYAMTVYNGQLIAGGIFDTAGIVYSPGIAAYDGSNWMTMGYGIGQNGAPGVVQALEVFKNKLYAGGGFDTVNSIKCVGMTVWNGTAWDSLAENPENVTYALKSFDGYLFIGGLSGYENQNILKYDGTTLSSVDSGVGANVYSLGVWNGSLYVGGNFIVAADTITANSIARWTPDTTTGIKQIAKYNALVNVYPNPTSNQLSFSSSSPIKQIQVEDVLGQTLIEQNFITGLQKGTMDVSALPQGIYFYRATDSNSQVVTGKFVLVK